MRVRTVGALLTAGMLLLSACGDDKDGDSASGDKRLSKEEFVKQANSICENVAEPDENIDPEDPAQLQKFLTDSVTSAEQMITKLRDLNPPEDLEKDFKETLDRAGKALAAVKPQLKDVKSFEDLENLDFDEDAINEGFDELGLTECGSGSEE